MPPVGLVTGMYMIHIFYASDLPPQANLALFLVFGFNFAGNNFKNLFVIIRAGSTLNATYETVDQARDDGAVTFNYGRFIQTIINFFFIAFALFWIVKGRMRGPVLFLTPGTLNLTNPVSSLVTQRFQRKSLKATSAKCPYCLTNVAKAAKKCPACTSWIDGRDGETAGPLSPEESDDTT